MILIELIDHFMLHVAVALCQQPPINVSLIDVNPRRLTFSWKSAVQESNCSMTSDSIGHDITSNCSTCSVSTRTTATCDVLLPSECTFSIRNMVCGQTGMSSDPIRVTLKGMQQLLHN